MSDDLINIEIDGASYTAPKGASVIQVADEHGILIPRFCYHKKLSVAANCRMCLIEVERAPKPLPACATPVTEGMKVFTRSALAIKAQKSVMEFLLINHPLDCPICDQGGECELQDVAMGYGRDLSRFSERKRVVQDKNLGPLIATDMTRCIHCTRCVRFGAEIAGMPELGATGRGEHMQIGTFVERSVDSELSGNAIDVCPVGALTSKPFRYRARAWEMIQRDSVAPHDGLGSNLHLHIARGRVLRVVPRENESVNEVWLSDRDRYSYEGLYSDDRLLAPMVKRDGKWSEVDWETALDEVESALRRTVAEHGADSIGGLCSPSATLEELYLFQKLLRGIGCDSIDHRVRQLDFSDDDRAPTAPWLGQSVADLERIGSALIVGCDLRKEQPLINTRLRKAVARGAGVMLVNPVDFDCSFQVAEKLIVSPSGMLRALAGVARALENRGRPVGTFSNLLSGISPTSIEEAVANRIFDSQPASVLLGAIAVSHPQAAVLRALAGVVATSSGAALGYLAEGANAVGAGLAGALPHRGPGAGSVSRVGLNARTMMERKLRAYLLLALEPELDHANSAAASSALEQADVVVSMTAYRTERVERYADVMLPVAQFAETSGTFVNLQGSWQSFEAAVSPPGEARPGWKILRVLGNSFKLDGFAQVSSTSVRDELRARVGDELASNLDAWQLPDDLPLMSSGPLVRLGSVPMYSVDPLVRRAPALQQTCEAAAAVLRLNAALAQELGLQTGSHAAVTQNGARVELPVIIDARVADGCVQVPSGVRDCVGLGDNYGEVGVERLS